MMKSILFGKLLLRMDSKLPCGGKSQGKVLQDNDLVEMGIYSTVFASLEQNVSLHSCFETGYLLFSLYILLVLDLNAHAFKCFYYMLLLLPFFRLFIYMHLLGVYHGEVLQALDIAMGEVLRL